MAGFKPACAPTHADRRRQDILAIDVYENTNWFFSTVLCVFTVKRGHDMFGTKRSVRVADNIRREIAILLLREVRDPRIRNVTLTGAHVTGDLKQAKVFYSVIGDETVIRNAQAGLDSAKGFIKRQIGQRIELRYMPDILFVYDPSLEYGSRMDRILQNIHREEKTA